MGDYDNFVFGALFGLACGFFASLFVLNFFHQQSRAQNYSHYSLLLARLNELTNRDPLTEWDELDEEE
ncbi:hypothetical protein N9W89_00790 [Hellea sp.]|nr:hypothetical protein [Hellea sp.]